MDKHEGELACICVLRLSLYQARTVGGHVYYVSKTEVINAPKVLNKQEAKKYPFIKIG